MISMWHIDICAVFSRSKFKNDWKSLVIDFKLLECKCNESVIYDVAVEAYNCLITEDGLAT